MPTAQDLVDEIKSTWHAMKSDLDSAIPAHDEKIRRLNDRMDFLETKLQRMPLDGVHGPNYQPPKMPSRDLQLWLKMAHRGGPEKLESASERTAVERINADTVKALYGSPERKSLLLGDDTLGGFLAPPELAQEIIKGVQLISPMRQYARIRQTARRSVQAPVRSGVFSAQWVGESSTRTETTGLTFSIEELTAFEMYAEVIVSNQDLEDSAFDLAQEITDNASEQFAKLEGTAFIIGDGQKKPQGFLQNATTAIPQITPDNIGGASLTGDGLITFLHKLKSSYAMRATWFMNRATIGAVRLLKDSQGRYYWEPNYQVGQPPAILGVPVAEAPDMPDATAGNIPIALGDFRRGYWIVDRVDMSVQVLKEKYAEQGQTAYLVRKRVGGQVVNPEAIRVLKMA